ncbi:hypothetical protein BSLG_008397 [Batrachochytrium salamandrivorans]|nr:hypothetical protein BSLG_008397 [Batrachochytrium salamandrivorans]
MAYIKRPSTPCACMESFDSPSALKCIHCKRQERHDIMARRLVGSLNLEIPLSPSYSRTISSLTDLTTDGNTCEALASEDFIDDIWSGYKGQDIDMSNHLAVDRDDDGDGCALYTTRSTGISRRYTSMSDKTMATVREVCDSLSRCSIRDRSTYWRDLEMRHSLGTEPGRGHGSDISNQQANNPYRHSSYCECRGSVSI